jgi:ABC-type Mn2+/Zn2+ transport system permease subunit
MRMLQYDFMQNAFAATFIVACVAGTIGYFMVLRGQTFAGHAMSHVGFAGATGAVLLGVSPLLGLTLFTMTAGLGIGLLGERAQGRDVAIGIVLSLSLGLGLLFRTSIRPSPARRRRCCSATSWGSDARHCGSCWRSAWSPCSSWAPSPGR